MDKASAEEFIQFVERYDSKPSLTRLSAWHPAEFYFDQIKILPDVLNSDKKEETDLAAAYLHETAYKLFRMRHGEEKADRVNQFVAVVMSDLPLSEIHQFIKDFIDEPDAVATQIGLTKALIAVKTVDQARELSQKSEWVLGKEIRPELHDVFMSHRYLVGHTLDRPHYCTDQYTLLIFAVTNLNSILVEYLVKEVKVNVQKKVSWGTGMLKRLAYDFQDEQTALTLAKKVKTKTKEEIAHKKKIIELLTSEVT